MGGLVVTSMTLEHAEMERLRTYERHVYRLDSLPDEIAEAIGGARMDPVHDHLNDLLDND
jgi:hypothetical protein